MTKIISTILLIFCISCSIFKISISPDKTFLVMTGDSNIESNIEFFKLQNDYGLGFYNSMKIKNIKLMIGYRIRFIYYYRIYISNDIIANMVFLW
jgi:hypothetical protein